VNIFYLIAGILVFVAILHKPVIGVMLMVILLPIEGLLILPGDRTLIYAIGIVTGISWVFKHFIYKMPICFSRHCVLLAAIYCLWGLLSFSWAYNPVLAFGRASSFFNMVIFYFLFQDIIRKECDIHKIIILFWMSSIGCSLYSFFIDWQEMERLALFAGQNPNELALNLGVSLLLSSYLFNSSRRALVKSFVIGGDLLIFSAIIMSGSRGTWIALPLSYLIILLYGPQEKKSWAYFLTGSVAFILLVRLLFISDYGLISAHVVDRLKGLFTFSIEGTQQFGGRLGTVEVALRVIADNPILGVGWDNFPVVFPDYAGIGSFQVFGYGIRLAETGVHNMYIAAQAELGIIGSILLFSYLYKVVRPLMEHRGLILQKTSLLIILFLLICGLKSDLFNMKILWFVTSISTTASLILETEKSKVIISSH